MDTYLPDDGGDDNLWREMFEGMPDREDSFGGFSAPRLAAMSRYGELILDRSPGALTVPVLFVRPADSFVREVPGNDFTLLEEWLAAPPGGGSAAGT
ncbi:hypothetical protein AB0P45_04745 [Streptomyces niveus]|uniref:hypothetical protein n=1 Tax=Streptomyces niveus TaxID=193462 RepID=UPI003442F5FF